MLPDLECDPKKVTKVVFCSGKHWYNLHKERAQRDAQNVALIRLEVTVLGWRQLVQFEFQELCPFPAEEVRSAIQAYSNSSCLLLFYFIVLFQFRQHHIKFKLIFYSSNTFLTSGFIWSQEEHRNQGAWSFIAPRFANILGIKVSQSIKRN